MSSNGEGKKTRQPRTTFSSLQLQQLKSQFQRNQKPTSPEEAELAASLGLTHIQVCFSLLLFLFLIGIIYSYPSR